MRAISDGWFAFGTASPKVIQAALDRGLAVVPVAALPGGVLVEA